MTDYTGEHIWIIGASSGIGSALAHNLAKRGATLALSARRSDRLEEVKSTCEGEGHIIAPMDVGELVSVHTALDQIKERFHKIDRVIFMAAIYSPGLSELNAIDSIHNALRINIGGAYNMLDAIIPHYKKMEGGQISICASVAGYRGLPKGQPYCSTKAALINLAESIFIELKKDNIDVKIINPGFVRTPLTDKNDFQMPMMIEPDKAAQYISEGLSQKKFEIHFPKKFTFFMKILRILPNSIFFLLTKRMVSR